MPKRLLLGTMAGAIVVGGSTRWCSKNGCMAVAIFSKSMPDRIVVEDLDDDRPSSKSSGLIHDVKDAASHAKRLLNNVIREKQSDAAKLQAAEEENTRLKLELIVKLAQNKEGLLMNHIVNEDAAKLQAAHEENSRLREELLAKLAQHDDSEEKGFRGASKFNKGDIVEMIHNRILAPFKVVAKHSISDSLHIDYYDEYTDDMVADYSTNSVGYDLVRISDGFKLEKVPESSLRQYEPYPLGSTVLCNLGELGSGTDRIIPCSIQGFKTKETSSLLSGITHDGTMMFDSEYKVIVLDKTVTTNEFETTLPLWRLQRRNDHDT